MKNQFNQARPDGEDGSNEETVEDPIAQATTYKDRAAGHLETGNAVAALADSVRMMEALDGVKGDSRIPDSLLQTICARVMENGSGELEGCRYWTTLPSFYYDSKLIRIKNDRRGIEAASLWFLYLDGREKIIPLDRASHGVTMANALGALSYDEHNVLDYLKFFCFFEPGDEGPFFVVENMEHPVFDLDQMESAMRHTIESSIRQPEVEWHEDGGRFEIGVSLVYVRALFQVRFSLRLWSRSCDLVMIKHERVIGDIPVRKVDSIY